MLEKIDSPEGVVALKAVGKLEKKDYDSVLLPALRAMIDGPGEIRLSSCSPASSMGSRLVARPPTPGSTSTSSSTVSCPSGNAAPS